MFRSPLRLNFLGAFALALLSASAGFSANKISDQRVLIDTPLSEADITALKALKSFPELSVGLDKDANAEAFASLARFPDIRAVHVEAGNAHISDLSPMASIPRLRSINLHMLRSAKKSPVSLAPLARCTELERASFQATPVTDVNALAACPQLREVSLYMSDVDSIDFLRSTPRVRSLSLYGFGHTFPDYKPVAGLADLRELDIYMNTQATDANLSVLKKLTDLRIVRMANSKHATSLDFLSNCTELEELRANWCDKLGDIRALARMPYLEHLDLSSAPIGDIAPLAGKTYLARLFLEKTQVSDLSPLRASTHLDQLNLSETAIKDLSPLAGMRVLQTLDISKTGVADLAPLRSLRKLRMLNIQGTAVTDLSALHDLEKLQQVKLSASVPAAAIEALKASQPKLTVVIN